MKGMKGTKLGQNHPTTSLIFRIFIGILILVCMILSLILVRLHTRSTLSPHGPYSPLYRIDHGIRAGKDLSANAQLEDEHEHIISTNTVFNPPPTTTVLTIAILTSPRPNNDIHLLRTIHSIIDQFKHMIGYYDKGKTMTDRFNIIRDMVDRYQLQIIVVNHFGRAHGQYYALQSIFEDFVSSSVEVLSTLDSEGVPVRRNTLKSDADMMDVNPLSYLIQMHFIDDRQLKFDIEDDIFQLQKTHASSLLKHSLAKHREKLAKMRFKREEIHEYIMLLEDDFPVCSREELVRSHAIPSRSKANGMSLLYHTLDILSEKQRLGVPFCGLFVGTGGSGFAFSQSSLEGVIAMLDQTEFDLMKLSEDELRSVPLPHDLMIQRCLSGGYGAVSDEERQVYDKYCNMCKTHGSLHVSGALWFQHIGHFSSTVYDRIYDVNKWSCGTKQTFASSFSRFVSRVTL